MKKTKCHVLKWDICSNSTPSDNGMDKKRRNKGIVFEDIVEKLITAMFPDETWRRTGETHDGKRDFVSPADLSLPEKKWAECKNYSSNLSLNVVAPTLIMGAIENIESILFFSFNPLNDNALSALYNYSVAYHRTIRVFDGLLLDNLVCKYHRIADLDSYFPDTDFFHIRMRLGDSKIRIVKSLRDFNGNKLSQQHHFELGETFRICLLIQNLSYEPVDLCASFSPSKEGYMAYSDHERRFSLPMAGITEYCIDCQALKAGCITCRVYINIENDIETELTQTITVSQKVVVVNEPFLFWSGESALYALNACKSHLSNPSADVLLISAGSGMGKSTLLNILLHDQYVQEHYKTITIDIDVTRSYQVRKILSQAIGVRGKDVTPTDQQADEMRAVSLLVDNYAESAKAIANTILSFYDRARPYLFVIDNIQRINRSHIELITELQILAKQCKKPVYYLFALNDEVSTGEQLKQLLPLDVTFHVVTLHEFNKNDVIAYLKHKFGLREIETFFDGMERGIRPLELHIFCSAIKKKGVISVVRGSSNYHVVSPFEFVDNLKRVLYANLSMQRICELINESDIPNYVLKYISIADAMSLQTGKRYFRSISELVALGILKETEGYYTFLHTEIKRYIKSQLNYTIDDYIDIYADSYLDDTAKAICVLNQPYHIRNGICFLKNYFIVSPEISKVSQRYQICWLIFDKLEGLGKCGILKDALVFVQTNYPFLKSEHGHAEFYEFMKHIVDCGMVYNWDIDATSVEIMAFLIKKYFDRSLSTHHYINCYACYEQIEQLFMSIKHVNDHRRNYWLSHYANRAAIAIDRSSSPFFPEPECVTSIYNKSEEFCLAAGNDSDLLFQITIDTFNRHYIYRHDLKKEHVIEAHEKLKHISESTLAEQFPYSFFSLLLRYLNWKLYSLYKDNDVLFQLRKDVTCFRENCSSAFYVSKLFLLEIYILMDLEYYKEAQSILSAAFEYTQQRDMRSITYKLTYIKAFLSMFRDGKKEDRDIYDSVVLAYEQMLFAHKDSVTALEREVFLLAQLQDYIAPTELQRIHLQYLAQTHAAFDFVKQLQKFKKGKEKLNSEIISFNMQSYFIFNGVSFPAI